MNMNQTQDIQENKRPLEIKKLMLEIKDLRKSFGDNHVLNGFNLELFEGENLVIMGKSGSGKSVMIKCLVGLTQVDSGSIIIMDKDEKMLRHMGYAVVDLQVKYRSSSLVERMEIRPQLDELLKKYGDYQLILFRDGVITTDEDLKEMTEIQKEIDQAAQIQQLVKALAKTIAFVATKVV